MNHPTRAIPRPPVTAGAQPIADAVAELRRVWSRLDDQTAAVAELQRVAAEWRLAVDKTRQLRDQASVLAYVRTGYVLWETELISSLAAVGAYALLIEPHAARILRIITDHETFVARRASIVDGQYEPTVGPPDGPLVAMCRDCGWTEEVEADRPEAAAWFALVHRRTWATRTEL